MSAISACRRSASARCGAPPRCIPSADRIFLALARDRGRDPARLPELGIAVTAYGVLSRGLISGNWSPDRSLKGDARSRMLRFTAANLEGNLALVGCCSPSRRPSE